MTTWNVSPEACRVHAASLVWDNHTCMPWAGLTDRLPELERHRRAGARVVSINVGDSERRLDDVVRVIAELRAFLDANPELYVRVGTLRDIEALQADDRLGVLFDVEGAFSIEDRLELVALYYELGVRWMGFAYNRRNLVGGGCHDAADLGLSVFGRALVGEMDRVGLVKDCSHAGYRTAMDVLSGTDKPTIFSHSNPSALCAHARNIPDDLIRACAATDGVICVNGVSLFLGGPPSADRISEHAAYVAGLVGEDHVGLGLDYVFDTSEMDAVLSQNPQTWPVGGGYEQPISFAPPELLPAITEALLARGFSGAAAAKVLGGNLRRVAQRVWR